MLIRMLSMFVSAFALSSCATLVVEPVKSPRVPDGVFYALPKTVVRVNLKVDRTAREGAEFVKYAAIFAPGSKVVCRTPDCSDPKDKKIEYTMQDGATISTIGVPDPGQIYVVKFTGNGAIDQSIGMTWNEQGLLSAANASVTNRTADIIMSGVKLAATLGTKGAFSAGAGATATTAGSPDLCPKNPLSIDKSFVEIFTKHAQFAASELKENYCAIEVKDGKRLDLDQDLLVRATIAYQAKIATLAMARKKILDATSIVSDAASVLPQIEAEIGKQLAILYLGTKAIKTWDGTLDVAGISEGGSKTFGLLKIDTTKGVCKVVSALDPEGPGAPPDAIQPPEAKSFPDGFHDTEHLPDCKSTYLAVKMTWDYYPKRDDQLFWKIVEQDEGKYSFRYRMPAQAKLWIDAANCRLISEKNAAGSVHETEKCEETSKKGAAVFSIAQLGKVIALPAKRHSKTLTYDLAFIEATGALKSFKLGTTGGVDAATIDSLTATSGMVLDAETARKKEHKAALDAAKTAQDELTILTREEALLTLRDTICTLKQKYGLACDDPPK